MMPDHAGLKKVREPAQRMKETPGLPARGEVTERSEKIEFKTGLDVAEEKGIVVEEVEEEGTEKKTKRRKVKKGREEIGEGKVKVTRVSFGIERLDDALEGGVPKGSWVVIGGEPGTGKSILAIHFAAAGLIAGDDKVIYVTTEQEFYDIVTQARQFGIDFMQFKILNLAEVVQWDRADREWTFEKPSKTPDIVVIDLFGLSRVAKLAMQEEREEKESRTKKTSRKIYAPWSIDTLIYALDKAYEVLEVERGQHIRLIIDSMSTFWVDKPAMARKYSYQLKLTYHRNNITALLTCQYAATTKGLFGFGAEHIADVVMETWMSDVKTSKKLERYLAIKKARMTAIKHYLFRIDFAKEGDMSKLILEPVQ